MKRALGIVMMGWFCLKGMVASSVIPHLEDMSGADSISVNLRIRLNGNHLTKVEGVWRLQLKKDLKDQIKSIVRERCGLMHDTALIEDMQLFIVDSFEQFKREFPEKGLQIPSLATQIAVASDNVLLCECRVRPREGFDALFREVERLNRQIWERAQTSSKIFGKAFSGGSGGGRIERKGSDR